MYKRQRNGTGPYGGLFIPPAVDEDSISMPGNQGGSNWGTTAANPEKGMVYVLGMDAVAILKLVDVKTYTGRAGGGGGANQLGATTFATYCAACHGANMQNPLPGVPNLTGVTNRVANDIIRGIVNRPDAQLILVDTPGLHRPRTCLLYTSPSPRD